MAAMALIRALKLEQYMIFSLLEIRQKRGNTRHLIHMLDLLYRAAHNMALSNNSNSTYNLNTLKHGISSQIHETHFLRKK